MEQNLLLPVSVLCLVVLLFIFLLKRLRQPYLVAYILAGLILGPEVLGVFKDTAIIDSLGEIGTMRHYCICGIKQI